MKALTTVLPARLLKKNIKVTETGNRSQEIGVTESGGRRKKKEEKYYLLPITHYLLPITHYPLPITHYLLPITKIDISYSLHNAPFSFYPD
ncbi:hypothetical protein MEO40_13525 [Dolichospermum sp. ST_sed1]|nr:hypothetical protein [Dolichospermum sp. ST_sed1]